jgi:hypothetical protein
VDINSLQRGLPLRVDGGAGHRWLTPVLLATWGAEIAKTAVQGQPGQIVHKPHLQNNQSKMDWRCGSRTKTPALQVQSSELKPQSNQKKNLVQGGT